MKLESEIFWMLVIPVDLTQCPWRADKCKFVLASIGERLFRVQAYIIYNFILLG